MQRRGVRFLTAATHVDVCSVINQQPHSAGWLPLTASNNGVLLTSSLALTVGAMDNEQFSHRLLTFGRGPLQRRHPGLCPGIDVSAGLDKYTRRVYPA